MELIKELRNDLMKRNEVEVIMQSDSNPGFASALSGISKKFKAEEDCIVVKKLSSSFGKNRFVVQANIYDSAKDKNHLEAKKKEKKTKGAQ